MTTEPPRHDKSVPPAVVPCRSRRKRWMFRVAAMLFGFSLFIGFELLCWRAGWGRPTDYPDPFVGFSDIHPLFVLNEREDRYEIPPSRLRFFRKDSFPATKGERTFRVFCFGGSTVQGRPYAPPTSFPTWLRLSLAAGDSRRDWEVVNCGGISYASYRLTPIVKECLQYQPDLFVICTGHNEFLEDRTYQHIKNPPRFSGGLQRTLSRLHTVTLMRSVADRFRPSADDASKLRPTLNADVNAMLDRPNNALADYHRDDEWRAGVVQHFEFNLRRMIDLAESAGVPVILILPPSDLRDTPPFKSEHKAGLSVSDRTRWETLVREARSLYRSDLKQAAELLRQAFDIDDQHAGGVYELARCYDSLASETLDTSLREQVKPLFRQARDFDICPLRMIAPLEEAMRLVAAETGTPLIDAHALLEGGLPEGILGNQLLVDHVHPTPVFGHQTIADAVALEMQRREWFKPGDDWKGRRETAFRAHLRDLSTRDKMYFIHGKQTLEALRKWAKGRADEPPIPRKPIDN